MNNELTHHGVLGMKWGVRRFQNEDGSLTSKGRKRYELDVDSKRRKKTEKYDLSKKIPEIMKPRKINAADENASDDYKKAHDDRKAHELSDKELRERINRRRMEKEYSDLEKPGKKWVKGILIAAGTTVATALVVKYGNKGVGVAEKFMQDYGSKTIRALNAVQARRNGSIHARSMSW